VSHTLIASGASDVALSSSGQSLVTIVAIIAVAALLVAGYLVREVLAASEGTDSMKTIAAAVQEGASAYLNRQFKTLSIFVVLVFFVLFALPANSGSERLGRSIFFLVGAAFSALTGYFGMWLAVRGNVRVANAAREGNEKFATRIAFRTGGVVGMTTIGLGLLGASILDLVQHCSRCLCALVVESLLKLQMSVQILLEKLNKEFQKMMLEMPQQLLTTLVTTWVIVLVWLQIYLNLMQ
jgi:K(+)-stimulated pyrophosphate-energized sodium pump